MFRLLSFVPAHPVQVWRPRGPHASAWLTFLCLVSMCATLAIQASPLAPLPVEDLTRHADLVLHGKVLSKTVLRDPAGRIYTRLELGLIEVWKGAISGGAFVIVHGGGTLGDERVEVSDQASYAPAEEVVAFLRLNDRGEGVTLSLSQGKFAVFSKPGSGEKLVASRYHGAGAASDDRAAESLGTPVARSATPLRFLDFRQAVLDQVHGHPNGNQDPSVALARSRAQTVSAMIGHPAASFPAGW